MAGKFESILGPRVPEAVRIGNRARFVVPTVFLIAATVLLLASFGRPYWSMTLEAPAHPEGLRLSVYLNHIQGDVGEINAINAEIGMQPLDRAASLERHLSWIVIVVFALLVVSAVAIHSPWAAVASLPALLFPVGFLADMHFWLSRFGQGLDPSSSGVNVAPFAPSIIGRDEVGEYATVASLGSGFILAAIASAVILVGLFFHRRAYKPMLDAKKRKAAWGWGDEPTPPAAATK